MRKLATHHNLGNVIPFQCSLNSPNEELLERQNFDICFDCGKLIPIDNQSLFDGIVQIKIVNGEIEVIK